MDADFDAILCDMVMPRLAGDMFYLAISKVKPHLCKRFVFITGHASDPSIAAFLAATQQPVLAKPAGLDHLLGVLQWIIRTNSSIVAEKRRMEATPNGRLVLAN
jgi:CheY-like chemotaxis protein